MMPISNAIGSMSLSVATNVKIRVAAAELRTREQQWRYTTACECVCMGLMLTLTTCSCWSTAHKQTAQVWYCRSLENNIETLARAREATTPVPCKQMATAACSGNKISLQTFQHIWSSSLEVDRPATRDPLFQGHGLSRPLNTATCSKVNIDNACKYIGIVLALNTNHSGVKILIL